MSCLLSIVAPYDLSEFVTYSSLELEDSPAPFEPDLNYIYGSECSYNSAIWRFVYDTDFTDATDVAKAVGQYPASERVISEYFSPLSEKIKGRTYIQRHNLYTTYQKNQLVSLFVNNGGVFTYYRYKSKIPNNKNNALPSGNSSNNEWLFFDNSKENYTYLPVHTTSQSWDVGSVVWVSRYPVGHNYEFIFGRAWQIIKDIPQADVSPDFIPADLLRPPTLSKSDKKVEDQFWEFVRLGQPLRIFDTSPYTQSEQSESIKLELTIGKPLTDVFYVNADADSIDHEITSNFDSSVFLDYGSDMLKPITKLWEFREPRKQLINKHISGLPFYPSTTHKISINKDLAKIASIITGQRFDVGTLQLGTSTSASSLGGIEKDDFETLGIKKGRSLDSRDYVVHVDSDLFDSVDNYLRSITGNIVYVIVPDSVSNAGGLGRLVKYNFLLKQSSYYVISIQLEGIVDYDN